MRAEFGGCVDCSSKAFFTADATARGYPRSWKANRSIMRNRRLESHDTFPEFWLGMQKDYDPQVARDKFEPLIATRIEEGQASSSFTNHHFRQSPKNRLPSPREQSSADAGTSDPDISFSANTTVDVDRRSLQHAGYG
jgi:hypothetical protein